MKKYILCLVLFSFLSLNSNSAKAKTLNDFNITNFDITYNLSISEDGESILETKEVITADFVNKNTNRGIEREIPNSFDNRKLKLEIVSVQDAYNNAVEYTTYTSGKFTIIRIGDPNQYVNDLKTYQISYKQYDVTKYYPDTNRDEWYWNTNGLGWRVPINNLSIKINLNGLLYKNLDAEPLCYYGISGSSKMCTIKKVDNFYAIQQTKLDRFENVSIAFGFKDGTFREYEPGMLEKYFNLITVINKISLFTCIPILIYIQYKYKRIRDRLNERQTIVTEYIPLKNIPVIISAKLIYKHNKLFTAQLIDLAVRNYIKIYKTNDKSLFTQAEYEIEISKPLKDLKEGEIEILNDLFGNTPLPGSRIALKSISINKSIQNRFMDNDKKFKELVIEKYKLRQKDYSKSKLFRKAAIASLLASIPILNLPLFIIFIILLILSITLKPLTEEGLQVARYLDGLEKYIQKAEEERFKLMQSPNGVEKIKTKSLSDKRELINVYERLLPYAIIFGLEKKWSEHLENLYQTTATTPIWIYNSGGLVVINEFSSAINSFSTSTNFSSISGGTSGGGFSGGGGGGGGGGGW